MFFPLYPFIFSDELEGGLKAFIGADEKEIALSKLIVVPRFLRFDQVALEYRIGSQHILQKCDSFHGYLSSIKATLTDSNLIQFVCQINEVDPSQFQSHPTVQAHIRSIVSICDSSRGYSFVFRPFTFDDHIASIASYLGMPAISRSSFVSFSFTYSSVYTLKQLPVEAISNWLNRERNAMDQNQRERCIKLPPAYYSTIKEICDSLKQVAFNFEYLVFLVRYLRPLHLTYTTALVYEKSTVFFIICKPIKKHSYLQYSKAYSRGEGGISP